MSEAIIERGQTWCQAIPGDAFCGQPSRYEDSYEKLLAEIANLESVEGSPCDWNEVLSSCDDLLRNNTKDMGVLGPLCLALMVKDGVVGLASGLFAYRFLIEGHSAEMFPKAARKRGRAGAFSWFTDGLSKELESYTPDNSHHEALKVCVEQFAKLDDLLRDELESMHPRVGPINKAFEAALQSTAPPPPPPEPSAEPAPAEGGDAGGAAAAPVAAAPPPPPPPPPGVYLPEDIDDDDEAKEAIEGIELTLKKLASYYLNGNNETAIGWHLAHLAGAFCAVVDGNKAIPAPNPQQLRQLKTAFDEGEWSDCIGMATELVDEGVFDINVQRYMVEALEEVEGDDYKAVAQTVKGQAVGYYLGMGDFANASAEVGEYFESLLGKGKKGGGGGGGEAVEVGPNAEEERVAEVVSEAEKETKRKGLDNGCRIIQDALALTGSTTMRFRLRLALGKLCVENEAADIGRPLLQDLYQELQQPLATWETGLLVQVTTTLIDCYRQIIEHVDDEEKTAEFEVEASKMMTILARADTQAAFQKRASDD
jgi:type VI secretion system protein VasJ